MHVVSACFLIGRRTADDSFDHTSIFRGFQVEASDTVACRGQDHFGLLGLALVAYIVFDFADAGVRCVEAGGNIP